MARDPLLSEVSSSPSEGMVAEESDADRSAQAESLGMGPEDDVQEPAPALSDVESLETEAIAQENGPVPCQFVCGRAGTGKSFWCKSQIAADEHWGLLTASTGIAAVNLDAVTINSTLKYFDTASLRENYLQGNLTRVLHDLALQHRRLCIDEISMTPAEQLDYIYRATAEANGYKDIKEPMGLVLAGDFAQLPSIKARWAFEANCWPEFAANTLRLTKIYRQDQIEFLDALEAARRGDGATAASILSTVGVEWHTSLDVEFDGTTIIPRNDAVDRFNGIALDRVPGRAFIVGSKRWGRLRSEWKNIPERLQLKVGAYVMCLSNDSKEWQWVNGDCGHVVDQSFNGVAVKLIRTGGVVTIAKIIRDVSSKDKPAGFSGTTKCGGYLPYIHRDDKGRYVEGQVDYLPLRLASASTVHKSQGLSLDRIQVDFRQQFFGSPALLYVALSRCRTLEGLRLVGDRERFIKQCNADPRVAAWL